MLKKIDELKLIAQCALTDNREAFGRLVEAYQSDIRRMLLNLTGGDVSLSDDLAQETFIKAYLAIRSFKGLSGFRTWLYRIACNEFYAWNRKMREEMVSEIPENTVKSFAESSDAIIDVKCALQQLPGNERIVIVLFYIEERSIKDISRITGMPEGTVKSHLSRAKSKLVDYFKQ